MTDQQHKPANNNKVNLLERLLWNEKPHRGQWEVSENCFGCILQKGFRIKWKNDEWFKVVIKVKDIYYDDDTFLEKSHGDENACYIIKEIETYQMKIKIAKKIKKIKIAFF